MRVRRHPNGGRRERMAALSLGRRQLDRAVRMTTRIFNLAIIGGSAVALAAALATAPAAASPALVAPHDVGPSGLRLVSPGTGTGTVAPIALNRVEPAARASNTAGGPEASFVARSRPMAAVPATPNPASFGLAIAGLGLIGFVTKRRPD